MKKLLLLAFLISSVAYAQKNDKDLWSLIQAERSFSKMSADKNLKEAFINYFAPNSVAVEGGLEVNGLENAKKMQEGTSYVVWEPNFADISASKDFGYTTGPVKFYKAKTDTVPLGAIYYSTMWQKQPSGEWKVIFDLGSGKAEPNPPALSFTQHPLSLPAEMISKTALNDVLQLDKEYIAKLNAKNGTVEASYFSDEGRVHRPRTLPVRGKAAIEAYTDPKERVYTYKQLNGRVANSGDLAFTYGTIDIVINPSANPQNGSARYFRVWKKEAGGWKIVLDVLG